MIKLVVLKLDGDLENRVRVTLEIGQENSRPIREITGYLPGTTELAKTVSQWQSDYRSLGNSTRGIKAVKVTYDGSVNDRLKKCKDSAQKLKEDLNNWLLSDSFRPVRETWLKYLSYSDEVRVLVRTSCYKLREIPWHLWDLVEDYPNLEVALGAPEYTLTFQWKTPTYREKVKILAILGNSTGINIQQDRLLLEKLPDTDTTFLVEPQRQDINEKLWKQNWDILFFAGHSQTEKENGRIYINQTDNFTISELQYALKNAVSNNLQLAIFNSCDGLGLAYELEELHIPQVIVMREAVPDEIAQTFLKYFLTDFATNGKSFYLAQKEARLKLQGLEDKYPCASWLPVIFQNPATMPPSWLSLGRRTTSISPYRELFAFQEQDAAFFFGREHFTNILVEAAQKKSFVAVIGASGSGKSSVVFAGLVKHLRDAGKWHIVSFRPGDRPLHALATALINYGTQDTCLLDSHSQSDRSRTDRLREIRNFAEDLGKYQHALRDLVDDIMREDPSQRLLLVADQFEELYTLCQEPQERKAFLDRLLEAIHFCRKYFTFVITLRADFLGLALEYRPFADALQYADLKLGPMTDEELQAAIEKPAGLLSVTIETGLTERILSAVRTEPGSLPLLEFALTQLWEKQVSARLTHAVYEEIGGVEAALAHYADQVYNQLDAEEKERARRIFMQLVRPGSGTEDTRRVANRTEIGEKNWELVTRLASARLVTTSRNTDTEKETVEIVHEALITKWERLYLWLEFDRNFRTWQERLRVAIQEWLDNGQKNSELLQGTILEKAEAWLQERHEEISETERDFIRLSLQQRDRKRRKKEYYRRLVIFGLAGFSLFSLALAVAAFWQWRRAETVQEGQISALNTYSGLLGSSNRQFDALIEEIRAGQQVTKQKVSPEINKQVVAGLRRSLYQVSERNRLEGHKNWVNGVSFSPDGQIIATASNDNTVKLWAPNGQLLRTLTGHEDRVNTVVFSPDGKTIATASFDKTVKLWNLNGKLLQRLEGHGDDIWGVSFSPNGQLIATASDDQTVKLWSRSDGKLIQTLTGYQNWVRGVSFSPDGKLLATASRDKSIKLWSSDGKLLRTFNLENGHQDWIDSLSFSPDGKAIATASRDRTIKLWSLEGKLLQTLTGHDDWVKSVKFSPNGKTIASSSADRTVKIWSLDGQLLQTLAGHGDWVESVSFSPDGKTLATASKDNTAKLWNLENQELRTFRGHSDEVWGISFSPDSKAIATASVDKTVKIWSVNGNLPPRILQENNSEVRGVSFSPDGKIIATASDDKIVRLWSEDGSLLGTLEGHEDQVWNVHFSPDGKSIVTASLDDTAKVWSLNGQLLHTFKGHKKDVLDAVFSPDGKNIVTTSKDYTVKVWSFDGQLLSNLTGHNSWVRRVVFSPDGQTIATASDDKTVRLYHKNGDLLHILRGHNDEVRGVSFSPDGKIIATGSADGTLKIWSLDGQELQTFTGHKAGVENIAFSPDGKTLASVSKDKSLILRTLDLNKWVAISELDLQQLLERGCDWVGDYLKNNPNGKRQRHLCDGIDK